MNLLDKNSINLIKEITKAELKSRDQSKILGFLWNLLYPIIMFLIMYFIFFKWSGKYVTKFAPYLLVGIIEWNYFVNATNTAMAVILRRRGYVRSFSFPYEILIMSSILSNLIVHICEIAVLLILLYFINNGLSYTALLYPLVIIIETFLVLGISLMLSALYIFFRDVENIWAIVLRLSIFITPIFYSLDMLSPRHKTLIMFNPLTYILNISRSVLVYKTLPMITDIILIFLVSLVTLLIGYKIFNKSSVKFSEFV